MGRPSKAMQEYAAAAAHPTMRAIARVALRQRMEQRDLAEARGVAESTIQRNFEAKQPTSRVVLEYCKILAIKGRGARALAGTLGPKDYVAAASDFRSAFNAMFAVPEVAFAQFERLSEDKRRRALRDFLIGSEVLGEHYDVVNDIAARHGIQSARGRLFAESHARLLTNAIQNYGIPLKLAISLAREAIRSWDRRGYISDVKAALRGFEDDYLSKGESGS